MSIFDPLFKVFGRSTEVETQQATEIVTKDSGTFAFPSPGILFALGGFPSDTGIPVTPFTCLQVSTVYACIKVLSEDVAKLPLRVRKKLANGGWKNSPDHPINKLLHNPNGWMTPFEFWAYMVVCQQLRGNGYAAIIRDGFGNPIKLIPLIPDRVMVLLTDEGNMYYRATAPQLGKEQNVFAVEDMIHIRNMTLDAGILGVSPITISQNVVGVALATQKNAATLFKQGSMPRGVLKMPPGAKLSPEAATRISQDWAAVNSGSDNAHKTVVLESGMEFEGLTISPEDAQLLDSRRYSGEEICRIFRVPQHKVGILDHATFSNIENQNQQYIDDALMGICRRIEETLERVLLFDDERDHYQIRFDFNSLLRGDFKSRAEAYQLCLLNGVLNRNEVREREGLPPVLGGDEFRVPLNTGPVTTTTPKPTISTPEANEPEKPDEPK